VPTIDPRIAMGIDEEWRAIYKKFLRVDISPLKDLKKKRAMACEK